MRIALYARVSKREQAEGYSLDAQLDAMRAYAEAHGWEVVREYIDPGFPGRTDERPAFRRLIRDAMAGLFDAILVHSLDRFARSRFISVSYKALLRQNDIFVYSVTEPVDHTDASSVITEGMLEVIHEWYSAKLAVETRKGMKRMVAEGGWPHRAPFGYANRRNDRETWLEVTEASAMIVHAFQEFSTGQYTLESWTEMAWELGYRNADGGKIYKSQWHRILRNSFYIGLITWDGQEYQGSWPTLIDPLTFQRVQETLDANRIVSRTYSPHRDYLLSGLLWSRDSNSAMSGTIAKGRYCYYRSMEPCSDNGKRHYVRCEILEDAVAQALYDVIPTSFEAVELFDPSFQLAVKVAPSLGDVYGYLEGLDEKRDVLCTVFKCLYIGGQEITSFDLHSLFGRASRMVDQSGCEHNSEIVCYQILSESSSLSLFPVSIPARIFSAHEIL